MDALDVHNDTEIDWTELLDPDWGAWNSLCLQKKWETMKNRVVDFQLRDYQGQTYSSFHNPSLFVTKSTTSQKS